ncbi:DnaJ domain-containing protein [Sporomusa sphaeroides]|uniref:Chaperone protein DnaJ n=1 Tax=Sporomusa sphaeroides DSM 2875 TaxID=1337886 RepID=A0A1U7M9V5_9FIRM|nr:J domain-containing protein [Sporomusa sphaeroides]OLS54329.1 chaperone protein DnaJ [Sporomusa sphaeroides DSM 2875]CVK21558.1 Chaperone protein DnaJ [Sporomusa sphaeroides DSM 2875]
MYFQDIHTIDELKKAYRKLAFKHHPDRGGDTEIMKAVNAEYEQLFKKLNVTDEATGKAKFNMNDGFREMIDKIINLDGLEIEICGLWIWVSGNTKGHKEALKEAGFFWASKKKMWYWRPEEGKVRYSTGITDMDYIRNMYGSEAIKTVIKKEKEKEGQLPRRGTA